jgi:hypothetical protein
MVLAYITYIILIAVSPILGMLLLRFVYPDVKTLVRGKKIALYVAFGLAAYVPAAVLGLYELGVSLYSPIASNPLIFEYEGNAFFAVGIFLSLLVINSSAVDYLMVRRRKTVMVGIPNRVIQYGIKQEVAKHRKAKREQDINRITSNIQSMVDKGEEINPLIEKIRLSVSKEKKREGKEAQEKLQVSPAYKELGVKSVEEELERKAAEEKAKEESTKNNIPEKSEEVKDKKEELGEEAEKDEEFEGLERELVEASKEEKKEKEPSLPKKYTEVKTPNEVKLSNGLEDMMAGDLGKDIEQAAKTKKDEREEYVEKVEKPDTLNKLKQVLDKEGVDLEDEKPDTKEGDEGISKEEPNVKEAEVVKEQKEDKNVLVAQLENRLKKATEDVKKKERIETLLDQLKDKLQEDYETEDDEEGDDVEDITKSLRSMRSEEKEEEEKPTKLDTTSELEASLASEYGAKKGKRKDRRGDDIIKTVVGDVRQQLASSKDDDEEEESEEDEESRWYDKQTEAPAKKEEGMDLATPDVGGNVELFEDDISLGEGGLEADELGDLGDFGDEFGNMGDLENLGDDVGSGDFDGMFVNMGEGKREGCPTCGKKGTTIVYCSNCGKPFCSNCAASVEGSDDYVKYKCPHCKSEFALKRRMPA